MKVKILNHEFYTLVNHFENKIYDAINDVHSELINVNVGIENSSDGWLAFTKEWLEVVEESQKDVHYNNENGSLYLFAHHHNLNAWEFDILKRIVRCRKKGQFKEDLEKTKRVIDLYLKEFEA